MSASRLGHLFENGVEYIGAFIRANLPSGFLKPHGVAFVLHLWPSLLLFDAL
jgi:hypothetical protein